MITMDKCIKMNASLTDSIEEGTLQEWCRKWEEKTGFERLDCLQLNTSQMERLLGPLETMKEKTTDLMERPALMEFELTIFPPVPMVGKNTIRFKETILPKEPMTVQGIEGARMDFYPIVDAYISLSDENDVDAVMTMFMFRAVDGKGTVLATGTAQQEYWRRCDPAVIGTIEKSPDEWMDYLRDIRLGYLAIQRAMCNRPEVFVKHSGEMRQESDTPSKRSGKKSRVQLVKKIYINPEELLKYGKPARQIKCPCWGVVGHWRSYKKTGKQVWIKPYRKGKQRSNPSAYEPKEYVLPEGGSV